VSGRDYRAASRDGVGGRREEHDEILQACMATEQDQRAGMMYDGGRGSRVVCADKRGRDEMRPDGMCSAVQCSRVSQKPQIVW